MRWLDRFWQDGRIVLPLRLYHAMSSIGTLCLSCLLSSGIVFYLNAVGKINFTLWQALGICCLLTVLFGGFALAWEAKYYIQPAEAVAEASSRVAKGEFAIQIPAKPLCITTVEGISLVENFNIMARALSGMEQMNREFIGNVSHELKTPLSSIVGITELLQDGGLEEEEQREFLSLVHKEALRLSRLSRLDTQEIVMRQEMVSADEQIRQTLILLSDKIAEKEQALDIEMEELLVQSDPDLLRQIWLNLIDNALKYSPAGKTLHIFGRMEDGEVFIRIRDEGIGIPVEKQARIWHRFYQCEESHKEQGHGLGLSIVKRIVELSGGSISCQSKVGVGTEMSVRIPCKLFKKF